MSVELPQINFDQVTAMASGNDIAFSRGVTVFSKSISANWTPTITGTLASGRATTLVLELTVTGATRTITWPASVVWPGGTQPPWTVGRHLITLTSLNTGTTWYGSALTYAP
jgi:hypothetical protein